MPSEQYADINDVVREEWKEESDGFERVKDILLTTDYGVTAGDISDQALVDVTTSQYHLETLDNMGLARSTRPTKTTRVYTRNDGHYEKAKFDALDSKYTEEELREKEAEMTKEIESLEDKYGTNYPSRVEIPEGVGFEPGNPYFEDINRWKILLDNHHLITSLISYKKSQ